MPQKDSDTIYRIKLAGEAGDGIISAGELLMTAAARQGYDTTVVKSFPSNIRGGYTQTLVTIATTTVLSPIDECDIVLSMSSDAFLLDTRKIEKQPVMLVEATVFKSPECQLRKDQLESEGYSIVRVPIIQFARETAGNSNLRSTVALGILGELLHYDPDHFRQALSERYSVKGKEIVACNHIALESGYLWAGKHLNGAHTFSLPLPRKKRGKQLILEGNQAIALGALAAGCQFFSSYPITPATAIGDTLACQLHLTGGCSYQAEDEIAALGTVIGASFNGVKAMTATSGPGLSLMQELIGYASMVELPLVIVDVQRVGPSTGMPTKHSQDDLHAAIFGGHGEGQRIVIAPVSMEDCYHATILAFNCSEKYQCPVLLLSDSTQGLTKSVITKKSLNKPHIINRNIYSGGDITKEFPRYQTGGSPVNPVTVPGTTSPTYRTTGVEHDEYSNPINTPDMREKQMKRRFRKLTAIESEIDTPVLWDDEPSEELCDIGVCAWGFTALAARQAIATLRSEGVSICAVYPRLLFPVCTQALSRWRNRAKKHIVIEANCTGQYTALIKMSTTLQPRTLTIARGEPITPYEIASGIRALLTSPPGDII